MITKKSPINNELLLLQYKRGIKLIPPAKKIRAPLIQSIDSLLNLPMSFYLLDREGHTRKINEEGSMVCGYDSSEQSIGKSILEVGAKESAEQLIRNCHDVLILNSAKIFDEKYIRKDGSHYQFLSIKCPWYDQDDQVIGVCGFSIVLGKHELAKSLDFITALGLLNQSTNTHSEIFHFNPSLISQLTKREIDCVRYAIKGYTAKHIARKLGISFRTVQEYLTNIRNKLGATSKSQLIEMLESS